MKRLFWSLVALLSLGCLAAHAEGLKKEKFSRGAWEHDIGYVQAVRVGNTLYISGSVGQGAMPEAIGQAFGAIKETLAHYHLDFSNVVKETVYTTDLDALKTHAVVRRPFYGEDFPAATWVQVSRLYDLAHVIEVEVIAVFPE